MKKNSTKRKKINQGKSSNSLNRKYNKKALNSINTNNNNETTKSSKSNKDDQKLQWKAGNMLYPLPCVMVSCSDKKGNSNIITIAWTGTICTNPPMVYISIRPERYSYNLIKDSGEFVINLTTKELVKATDFCGVRSGKNMDKWERANLTKGTAKHLEFAPIIKESPLNIECKLQEIIKLGSHDMFIASVEGVQVSSKYMDENGKFNLNNSNLITYSHGQYLKLGEMLGTFGYSVTKKKNKRKKVNE